MAANANLHKANLVHKQHFVPAGYLREWKNSNGVFVIANKDGTIWKESGNENINRFWMYNLYDAVGVEWRNDNGKLVKGITLCDLRYANNDGTLSDKIQCKNHIEGVLKDNEDKFYLLRNNIKVGYNLKFKDWNFLIWFTCLMIYRNPYNFNMFDKKNSFLKQGYFSPGIYCSEMPLIPISTFVHDIRQMYKKLKRLSCCLFLSDNIDFYTGDVPVVSYSDESYFFPISPKIGFFIYDENKCKDMKSSNRRYILLPVCDIEKFNRAIIKVCKFYYVYKKNEESEDR